MSAAGTSQDAKFTHSVGSAAAQPRAWGGHIPAVTLSRRALLKAGGALVVTFGVPLPAFAQPASGGDAALGKTLDAGAVDGFFAVHRDGSVTCYFGKVDLGTGLRIAMRADGG